MNGNQSAIRLVVEIVCGSCSSTRRDMCGHVNQAQDNARRDGWVIMVDSRGNWLTSCQACELRKGGDE